MQHLCGNCYLPCCTRALLLLYFLVPICHFKIMRCLPLALGPVGFPLYTDLLCLAANTAYNVVDVAFVCILKTLLPASIGYLAASPKIGRDFFWQGRN